MKISIITPVFNNHLEIEETIKSIFAQNFKDLEFIVVDGGSTDGTFEKLQNYKEKITYLISEKDEGLYHALNKGLNLATGDIIGILNSGDFYSNSKVLKKISKKFKNTNADIIYGDLEYVDKINTSRIMRYWQSGVFHPKKLKRGWVPPHPTLFMKKKCYNLVGLFNTKYKISSDYDLMLRVLKLNFRVEYIPEVLVKMRTQGLSNNHPKIFLKKSLEDWNIIKKNKIGTFNTLFLKKFTKIPQLMFSISGKKLPKISLKIHS